MTHTIETLPTDIILEIVKRLDSYALLSFLEVFPAVKDLSIVITDHSNVPLFFRVPGVHRTMLPIGGAKSGSTHGIQRYPIRLFDILSNEPEVMQTLVKLENSHDNLKTQQDVYINSTSFVYIHTNYTCYPQELEALTTRLDEFTDCHWHVGLPTHFNDKNTISILNVPMVNFASRTLTSLRLENVHVLKNCSFRSLRSLALIYTDSSIVNRPLVKGLKAKRLSRFVVHYTSMVPLFVDIDVATNSLMRHPDLNDYPNDLSNHLSGMRGFVPQEKHGSNEHLIEVFELARIDRLEYRACSKERGAIRDVLDEEALKLMDIDFISRFKCVHLYGVPAELIMIMDFRKVNRLRLQMGRESALVDSATAAMKTAEQLVSLSLVLQEDGCVFPGFVIPLMKNDYSFAVDPGWSLWLNIMGVKPKLKRLFKAKWSNRHFSAHQLTNLCIYSSPRLLRRIDEPSGAPVAPLRITHAEWAGLVNDHSLCYLRESVELSLIGFEMPFLNVDREAKCGWHLWGIPGCSKITLRPVIVVEPGARYHEMRVTAMYLRYTTEEGYEPRGIWPFDTIHFNAKVCTMIAAPFFKTRGIPSTEKRREDQRKEVILFISTLPMVYFPGPSGYKVVHMIISKSFSAFRWGDFDFKSTDASLEIMGGRCPLYEDTDPDFRRRIEGAIQPNKHRSNQWQFGYPESCPLYLRDT